MAKSVTTESNEGFVSNTNLGEDSITIDGSGEETADTLEHLLATYAACYIPALRVGAKQRNIGELGRIQIEAAGELNDNDKLESVTFDILVDTELDEEAATTLITRANELCKVHDALKPSLYASVTINEVAV